MTRITKILRKLDRETLAEVYYAGTFVRDIIRRKSPKRMEVVIRNLQLGDLIDYFEKYGTILYVNRRGYFVFHPRNNHSEIKISLPKRHNRYSPYFTLFNDASSRDFTVNAMFLPITSRVKKNIIDYFGGLGDLRNRKIRTVRNAKQVVRRYPLYMLKAVALAAELNYKIDSNLFYAIKSRYSFASKISKTDVRDQLTKILMSNRPSKYFKILYNLNLLNIVLPELALCTGVTQNEKYHKYDVFSHCVYACDNIKADLVLRLSALLHDIGKPQTREEITNSKGETKITFYNHEVMGAKLAKRILRRLKFDPEVIAEVTSLTYLHMYNFEPEEWTDAAIRRFIRKAEITAEDLGDLPNFPIFLLRRADRLANGHSLKAISYRQRIFEERIKEIYVKSKALDINDLAIDGNVIMNKFNLKAGPTIGHILNYLLSIVIEDQKMNTEETLIDATSSYLSKALK